MLQTSPMLTEEELAESVNRIKQTIKWFPGIVLGFPQRQIGKTEAVLELIHESDPAAAFYYAPSLTLMNIAKGRYYKRYPDEDIYPRFIISPYQVHGYMGPIYVDEWWLLDKADQKELLKTGRVVCRIGTEY
jgi:hypothetical protein